MYEKECIFYEKKDKYKKGIEEVLTQARELRLNYSAAIIKQDARILASLSSDLVAAEGDYHRTCYRHCTNIKESDKGEESEEDSDSVHAKLKVALCLECSTILEMNCSRIMTYHRVFQIK